MRTRSSPLPLQDLLESATLVLRSSIICLSLILLDVMIVEHDIATTADNLCLALDCQAVRYHLEVSVGVRFHGGAGWLTEPGCSFCR
eukprot:5719591-Heterocapsa_arctica.AAC.1